LFINEKAYYAQQRMKKLVINKTPSKLRIKKIAGVDVSYKKAKAFAGSVIYDIMQKELLERTVVEDTVKIPYFPGLLGFRETPIMIKALKMLQTDYDILLVDGHGIIHPRRFGLACHIGVLLDKPTIGVAKSHFIGEIKDKKVIDECKAVIGQILYIEDKVRYISIGHKISLKDAMQTVQKCIVNGSIIPLESAHDISVNLSEKTC
jgi:deoxyribonuclease V